MAVEVISRLAVEIGANIKAFTQKAAKVIKSSTKIKSAFKGIGKSVARMGKAVAKTAGKFRKSLTSMKGVILAVVSGVVLKKLKDFIFTVVDLGDQFAKTAKKIGIGVETLSGLKFAADLAGTSFQAVTGAFRRLSSAAFDAQQGLAESKRAFDALGVQVTDSDGKLRSLEDLFFDASDALALMTNDTERAALAQDLFGRAGLDLIPLLKQGSAAIRKQIKLAKELGITFSKEDAAAAEEFKDQLTILSAALFGFASRIVKDIVPAFIEFFKLLTTEFREVAGKGGGFTKALGGFIKGLLFTTIGAVEIMKSVWNGLKVVWLGLKAAWLGVQTLLIVGLQQLLFAVRNFVNSFATPFDEVFRAVITNAGLFVKGFLRLLTSFGVKVLSFLKKQLLSLSEIASKLPSDKAKALAVALSAVAQKAEDAAFGLLVTENNARQAIDAISKFEPIKALIGGLDKAIISLGGSNEKLRQKLSGVRKELSDIANTEAIPFWERAKQKIIELNDAIELNKQKLIEQSAVQNQTAENAKNKLGVVSLAFAEMFKQMAVNMKQFVTLVSNTVNQFAAGVGNAVARALIFGENFAESIKNVFKEIAASIISELIRIIITALIARAALSFFGVGAIDIGATAGAASSAISAVSSIALGSLGPNPSAGVVQPIGVTEAIPQSVAPFSKAGGEVSQTVIFELDGRELARVSAENLPSVLRVEAGLS